MGYFKRHPGFGEYQSLKDTIRKVIARNVILESSCEFFFQRNYHNLAYKDLL